MAAQRTGSEGSDGSIWFAKKQPRLNQEEQ